MAYDTLRRLIWDVIVFAGVFILPWIAAIGAIVLGLFQFRSWYEGFLAIILLDIVMFAGDVGLHSLYMTLGFCAVYYISIRVRYMMRSI